MLHISRALFCLSIILFAFSALASQSYPILRWQKFFGTEFSDDPKRLVKSPDGNLFIGGNFGTDDSKDSCSDIWIAKLDTNGNMLWERRLGGSGCEEMRDIYVTPDSGIIFVGITNSFFEHLEKGQKDFQGDYLIGKLSKEGEIDWLKTYGGSDMDLAYSITKSMVWDEYLVAGISNSRNYDVHTDLQMANMWALKLGEKGEKRSSWVLGGSRSDWAYSIFGCRNGDYIFCGFTNSEDIEETRWRMNGDGWVGRIDRYGEVIWQRTYSGELEDYFTRIIEDKDGRVVLVGNFESEKKGKQFWFLKLTADGNKVYERIFGDHMDEYATSIAETYDGGYIMTGYSKYINLANKYIKGGEDFWVFRLSGRGDVIWTNTFGGRDNERGLDIIEYRPGTYFALGVKNNDFEAKGEIKKKDDFWLLRIDEKACSDLDVELYISVDNYTAYTDRGFKLKAICNEGDSFLWDFGDGTTSEEKEPVKRYSKPGIYEVKVTIFINENCTKTVKLPQNIRVW